MEIKTTATLLTAESKAYSMNGNDGVSHKIRLSVLGEIYECKSSEAQVIALKSFEKQTGKAHFRLNSRKEKLSLELVSFAL